jgi:putative acetyltransferase
VPSLFRIWRDAVEATHGFLSAEDLEFFTGLVRDRYLPAASFTVAVDEEDRPIAFLGMTGAKIDSLFVAPERHGRGIGRCLLDHVRQAHPKLGVDVNEQNEAAVAFYERMGFRRVGRSELDDSGRTYPILHLETGG